MTPVPFLGEAAGFTLAILKAVDRLVRNKEEIKLLAILACEAIYTVQRTGGQQAEDREIREGLEQFKETMSNIQQFAEERTKKSSFFRFIMSNSEQQEIADFRTKLNHTINLLILRLNIRSHGLLLEIRNNTSHISATQYLTVQTVPSPAQSPPSPPFGGVFSGRNFGTVSVNNVPGSQVHTVVNSSSSVSNCGNIYTNTTVGSDNRIIRL